jgi:hypothetical protein
VFNKNHTIGGPPWPDPLAPAVPTSPVRSASSAGPLHYRHADDLPPGGRSGRARYLCLVHVTDSPERQTLEKEVFTS